MYDKELYEKEHYALRNIGNAALCISEWANTQAWCMGDVGSINWGDVGSANKVLEDLREICRFLNIELREV